METISLNRYSNNYIYTPLYNVERNILSFVCCLEDITMLFKYARWNYEKEPYRFIKHKLANNTIEIYDCLGGYITNVEIIAISDLERIVETKSSIADTKKYMIEVYGETIYNYFVR